MKNIRIGTAYLSKLRGFFDKKPNRYITAYNVGPGKILRIENSNDLPKFYSSKVLKFYEDFYKKISAARIPHNLASIN